MKTRIALAGLFLAAAAWNGCSKEAGLSTPSAEALHSYREGVSLWEKFYYTEAKLAFETSLKADSNFAMAWMRLAIIDASLDGQPKALDLSARSLRLSHAATESEQLFIRMWDHRLRFENAAAIATADSLIQRHPKDAEGYLFRGQMCEYTKDIASAIPYYARAAEIDTGYAIAVMSLGYAYSTIGEEEKAIAAMQRYIRLAPQSADPRASYADLLVRGGRYEEALEQYRKSLELKPDYWYAVREIGTIYALQGKLKAAEEQYHRSLKLLPPSPQIESQHSSIDAYLLSERGEYRESEKLWRAALESDSTNLSAAYGLALALDKQNDFSGAERAVQRIHDEFVRRRLGDSPAMLGYYVTRAKLLSDQGRHDEALADCDRALQFSVKITRPPVYRQIAEIRLRQKQFDAALDACSEALSGNPRHPETLLTLVRLYHEMKDTAMTREIGTRLLDFWKDADPDFLRLQEVKKLTGVRHGI